MEAQHTTPALQAGRKGARGVPQRQLPRSPWADWGREGVQPAPAHSRAFLRDCSLPVFQLHSKGSPNQGSKQPLTFPNSPVRLSSKKVPEESNREKPQRFPDVCTFSRAEAKGTSGEISAETLPHALCSRRSSDSHTPRCSPTLPQEKPTRACVSPLLRLSTVLPRPAEGGQS